MDYEEIFRSRCVLTRSPLKQNKSSHSKEKEKNSSYVLASQAKWLKTCRAFLPIPSLKIGPESSAKPCPTSNQQIHFPPWSSWVTNLLQHAQPTPRPPRSTRTPLQEPFQQLLPTSPEGKGWLPGWQTPGCFFCPLHSPRYCCILGYCSLEPILSTSRHNLGSLYPTQATLHVIMV